MERSATTYRVALKQSEEGFAVWVPGLPGCWSQGASEAEALSNIQDAIHDYLQVVGDLLDGADVREVRVAGQVPKLPGISHRRAVRAFARAGFWVAREGKHTVMTDGVRILTIPRSGSINAFTMGGLVRDAGLTIEQFKAVL